MVGVDVKQGGMAGAELATWRSFSATAVRHFSCVAKPRFMLAWRFAFDRFSPECYAYSVVFLLRNLMVSGSEASSV